MNLGVFCYFWDWVRVGLIIPQNCLGEGRSAKLDLIWANLGRFRGNYERPDLNFNLHPISNPNPSPIPDQKS